jgi:hypothetical protein
MGKKNKKSNKTEDSTKNGKSKKSGGVDSRSRASSTDLLKTGKGSSSSLKTSNMSRRRSKSKTQKM